LSARHYVIRIQQILFDFSFLQHVTAATHDRGGTLDVVITRTAISPIITVTGIKLSDHRLLVWKEQLQLSQPEYVTRTSRMWRNFDLLAFQDDLKQSPLCEDALPTTVEKANGDLNSLLDVFNNTIIGLLNEHAPE
jgi:hypothetical protein